MTRLTPPPPENTPPRYRSGDAVDTNLVTDETGLRHAPASDAFDHSIPARAPTPPAPRAMAIGPAPRCKGPCPTAAQLLRQLPQLATQHGESPSEWGARLGTTLLGAWGPEFTGAVGMSSASYPTLMTNVTAQLASSGPRDMSLADRQAVVRIAVDEVMRAGVSPNESTALVSFRGQAMFRDRGTVVDAAMTAGLLAVGGLRYQFADHDAWASLVHQMTVPESAEARKRFSSALGRPEAPYNLEAIARTFAERLRDAPDAQVVAAFNDYLQGYYTVALADITRAGADDDGLRHDVQHLVDNAPTFDRDDRRLVNDEGLAAIAHYVASDLRGRNGEPRYDLQFVAIRNSISAIAANRKTGSLLVLGSGSKLAPEGATLDEVLNSKLGEGRFFAVGDRIGDAKLALAQQPRVSQSGMSRPAAAGDLAVRGVLSALGRDDSVAPRQTPPAVARRDVNSSQRPKTR